MRNVKVGRYILGGACVEVWLTPADSSCARAEWTETGYGRVDIGHDGLNNEPGALVQALTHEFGEALLHMNGLGFTKTRFMRLEETCTSKFRFFLTHEDWGQISKELGDALYHAVPDLLAAYKKLRRK